MADLPPSSSDSLPPSRARSADDHAKRASSSKPTSIWVHIALFLATVFSMFLVSFMDEDGPRKIRALHGAEFAGTLTLILLFHEFGHYFAARIHKVEASLPFFIPLPLPSISPFGTMGAVIKMRGVIPNRRALLDIGASGPLAGLCIAIPAYFWGAAHSTFVPLSSGAGMELGESIALKTLDWLAAPNMPPGMELSLSPVAFAAWAGMLVTMINLFPVTQLDGGHVAHALLGKKHNAVALNVHRAMLVFFFLSVGAYLVRDFHTGIGFHRIGAHVQNSLFWLVWFHVLAILGTATASDGVREALPNLMSVRVRIVGLLGLLTLVGIGADASRPPIYWIGFFAGLALFVAMDIRGGLFKDHALLNHPEVGGEQLGIGRKIVAIVTLLWFVLLFMPAPISI